MDTLIATTIATFVSGAIMLLLTKIIEKSQTRDLEDHKSQVQAELEVSKLQFENELQIKLFEFQTKFSSLHQKQAEVIGELHGKMADTYEHLSHLVHPVQTTNNLEEMNRTTGEKYQDLAEFCVKHKIYLDENTSDQVDSVLKTMKMALIKWRFAQEHPSSTNSLNSWNEAWQSVSNEVPSILKELEGQFRKTLSPQQPTKPQ